MTETNEHIIEKKTSRRREVWKQFRKNKPALISFYVLCFMILIALFASFIANDQPLYVTYKGKTFYPAFSQHPVISSVFGYDVKDSVQDPETKQWEIIQYDITDWRSMPVDAILMPPIPYGPLHGDFYNRDFASPGDEQYLRNHEGEIVFAEGKYHHRLGTDALGRDVLSGMIHATKISLSVGVIAMGIAALIGLLLGAAAGYFGDGGIRISRIQMIFLFPGLFFGYFYGFLVRSDTIVDSFHENVTNGFLHLILSLIIFIFIPVLFILSVKKIKRGYFGKKIVFPLDSIINRFMEIFNAMPKLLLIISIAAVVEERSLWMLMVIIGLTSWTEIARFTRAEMLRVRETDYIQAARSMGFRSWRIIFRHALPNAMAPVFVTIAFGISSAILIESGLSFLNIGVPPETVTWGSMLNTGRLEPEAWWMIVFPGLAIFITVIVFNLIGDGLRDALDPKNKK